MRIYLDVCSLNRLYDDQSQPRIRREARAVSKILERMGNGNWNHVSSEMATIEIDAIMDAERRKHVRQLLPSEQDILKLTAAIIHRAMNLAELGFKNADALHLAAAEASGVDVFLSCDDRLCRRAKRYSKLLLVRVANPLGWLQEIRDATDA